MENTSAINPNETNSMANNNAWINGKIAQDAAVADVGQNADYGVRRGQHFLFNETISVCIPWQPTTVGIKYGVQATIDLGDMNIHYCLRF
ncbi:unnamed protein product [Rotaria socialis]|uniref:Uncharacterized protein n=2 Tax=Rotaria socialis TaxID=392032 RepID=A0A817MHJ6_9BILA|nr:unnamed protein product [Rotaria socialis]